MDAMGRLAACAADAVGRNPKEGWQDSLIRACDDVEEKYDELLAALEEVVMDIEDYCEDHNSDHPTDVTVVLPRLKAAIAKAKGGE